MMSYPSQDYNWKTFCMVANDLFLPPRQSISPTKGFVVVSMMINFDNKKEIWIPEEGIWIDCRYDWPWLEDSNSNHG